MNIYIASPLFSADEKKVISEVAKILHDNNHTTYLPMEHGVPDAWNYSNKDWAKKLFDLDKKAIDECDAVVCIYYGMNSDSGTAWEVGYSYGIGKPVIIYHAYDTKKDIGSLMICNGATENIISIKDIPDALKNFYAYSFLPYQS